MEHTTETTVTVQGRSQWHNRQKAKELMRNKLLVLEKEKMTDQKRESKNLSRDEPAFQWTEWRNEVKSLSTGKKLAMDIALRGKKLDKLIN